MNAIVLAPSEQVSPGARATLARYGSVTLNAVSVRIAVTEEDFEIVAGLRRTGFSRVSDEDPDKVAWLDAVDRAPGTFSLIATVGGQDVGTMRVQDGRSTPVELSKFINFMPLLSVQQTPVIQGARLSMLKTPQSAAAMIGLFKAVWQWSYQEGFGSIVIATPIWAKPAYDFLSFRSLGSVGNFPHPFARGAIHSTMLLSVKDLEVTWRSIDHPLIVQWFEIKHPKLAVNPNGV